MSRYLIHVIRNTGWPIFGAADAATDSELSDIAKTLGAGMGGAAIILAAVALAVATMAVVAAAGAVHTYMDRYRIRGLTGAQIRYARRVARRLRDRNDRKENP